MPGLEEVWNLGTSDLVDSENAVPDASGASTYGYPAHKKLSGAGVPPRTQVAYGSGSRNGLPLPAQPLEGRKSNLPLDAFQPAECEQTDMQDIRRVVLEQLEDFPLLNPAGQNAEDTGAISLDDNGPTEGQEFTAKFQVNWNVREFMKTQFEETGNTPIGSVIALSGSALCAQATTVQVYMEQHWPNTGAILLDSLELFLAYGNFASFNVPVGHSSKLQCMFFLELFLVELTGTKDTIVEVAQQLAWLGTALRTSHDCNVARSECHIFGQDLSFQLQFTVFPLEKDEKSCWHGLFFNAVIAYGFPINRRNHGEGLEIPIQMMSALAGASQAVEFDGGLLLKGFSSMLVPLKRVDSSVQWHYIRNEDESRLPYWEVDYQCPGRAHLDNVDYNALTTTRAFVGWWSKTATHLGTADTNYDNIDWSDTQEPGRSTEFNGGALGFQNLGAGQLNFSPGRKDGKLHISRSGPYQRIVKYASKTPVVLYDTCEKRAWLVPSSAVIAHIAQTRHFREPFSVDGKVVEFTPTDPSLDVHEGAEQMLLENCAVKLITTELGVGEFYFRDLVLNIWSLLESLMDMGIKKETSQDPAVHVTLRIHLKGWEFMDLVDERSPVRLKETTIQKSHGGWTDLAKDINAVVLFASGLEDIIKPVQKFGANLCHQWQRVPKDKDFLAASVSILNRLYEEAGSRLTKKYLTSTHLQWHRGECLFESCPYGVRRYECTCDRPQHIFHESLFTLGKSNSPGPLLDEGGAVIFGQSQSSTGFGISSRHQKKMEAKAAVKRASIYTQANTTFLRPIEASTSTSSPETSAMETSLQNQETGPFTLTSEEDTDSEDGYSDSVEQLPERAELGKRKRSQEDLAIFQGPPIPMQQPFRGDHELNDRNESIQSFPLAQCLVKSRDDQMNQPHSHIPDQNLEVPRLRRKSTLQVRSVT
ncbi:hypothetical protein LOCC1_G005972 [Lachnellula occidentalis]|uniref:Pfs domain protein n=1 Tax=Lachnellula occidentalis TaxID=215460 RepID=A0A8H8UEM5_9HELO|nr:hypothetical protein LOCC1_G005972 [Lachnellula occidentalis]